MNEMEFHRAYYGRTALGYDRMNVHERDEHMFAASALIGLTDFFGIKSVLEVGAGTGRIMQFLAVAKPELSIRGIEPIKELREVAYHKGIPREALVDGDGYCLQLADGEVDLACCFGVLHHVREPAKIVAELARVSRRAVLISDSNNFGQGPLPSRFAKRLLRALRLWGAFNFIRTGGKGYLVNESDGLHYSFSAFDCSKVLRRHCKSVYLFGTKPSGDDLLGSSSHIAMLGLK